MLVIAVPLGVTEILNEGILVVTVKGIDDVKRPSFVVTDIATDPAVIPVTKPSTTVATAGLEENHQLAGAVSCLVAPTKTDGVPVIDADVTGDAMRAVYP
jgi:hypothetical protein